MEDLDALAPDGPGGMKADTHALFMTARTGLHSIALRVPVIRP